MLPHTSWRDSCSPPLSESSLIIIMLSGHYHLAVLLQERPMDTALEHKAARLRSALHLPPHKTSCPFHHAPERGKGGREVELTLALSLPSVAYFLEGCRSRACLRQRLALWGQEISILPALTPRCIRVRTDAVVAGIDNAGHTAGGLEINSCTHSRDCRQLAVWVPPGPPRIRWANRAHVCSYSTLYTAHV